MTDRQTQQLDSIKHLRQKIKEQSGNCETVSFTLNQLGILVKDNTFSIRPEKTPSARINTDGSVHDYGSGEHYHDLVSLLYDGFRLYPSIIETVTELSKLLNFDIQTESTRKVSFNQDNANRLKQIREYISKLEKENEIARTPKAKGHDLYWQQLFELIPRWVWEQATWKAHEAFKGLVLWEKVNNTLLLKIYDYDNNLISFKRRFFNGVKWCTAKGTSPNQQCFISDNKQANEPLYILEGHHDLLTALMLNPPDHKPFNFIAIPTAAYKQFNTKELNHLVGRDIFFMVDIDSKETGYQCMKRLSSYREVLDPAKSVKLINLARFLDIEVDKLDFSDTVKLWGERNNAPSLIEFRQKLEDYCLGEV
ncbi:MAG TPA: hypothetical protein DCP51_05840 [Clostridiales bacterium]|nr:hypothetical protein [Clostridiales bacterium]HCT85381.1 hypothetical protein [Candidatus Margulisiibacteriota bacterium]